MTATAGGPIVLGVRGRSLVLVAGIPGAGKSSLLRGLPSSPSQLSGRSRPSLTVLDSDPLRERLRRRMPVGTAYRRYRPLVHLWHRARIARAALGGIDTVVVHLPATAGYTRGWLAALAAGTGRRAHLVWVHAEPAEARRGQHDRGRVLAGPGFARHASRGAGFVARLRAGERPSGWRVTLLERPLARRGLAIVVVGPR